MKAAQGYNDAMVKLRGLAKQYLSDAEQRIVCLQDELEESPTIDASDDRWEQIKHWESTKKQIQEVLDNDD